MYLYLEENYVGVFYIILKSKDLKYFLNINVMKYCELYILLWFMVKYEKYTF